jgi:beta-xylosidase
MTASSFNCIPGLPILHSRDMVNWRLVNHAIDRLQPDELFSSPQHGNGVWAPSIRYKVYLVYAYAGSRAGIKSVLNIAEMNAEGTKTLTAGRIIYDGHALDPTIEGPKCYKRNDWYYIFAPAGGVTTGWQTILRSRNIYGPYERKVVLAQGSTDVNGPHQGAWVTTPAGASAHALSATMTADAWWWSVSSWNKQLQHENEVVLWLSVAAELPLPAVSGTDRDD